MIYARNEFIYFSMSYEKIRFEPVKIMALKGGRSQGAKSVDSDFSLSS